MSSERILKCKNCKHTTLRDETESWVPGYKYISGACVNCGYGYIIKGASNNQVLIEEGIYKTHLRTWETDEDGLDQFYDEFLKLEGTEIPGDTGEEWYGISKEDGK